MVKKRQFFLSIKNITEFRKKISKLKDADKIADFIWDFRLSILKTKFQNLKEVSTTHHETLSFARLFLQKPVL